MSFQRQSSLQGQLHTLTPGHDLTTAVYVAIASLLVRTALITLSTYFNIEVLIGLTIRHPLRILYAKETP
jgi:hypothetical protein